MDNNNQSSESVTSKSPLDWLEYLALVGSVAGSAAAIAGQSVAFAATPLTLAVLVNFANRRRIDQLSLQNSRAARVQTQQISEQIQSLQQQMLSSAGSGVSGTTAMPDLQPLQTTLANLQQQHDGFQSTLEHISASLHGYEDRLTSLEQIPAPAIAESAFGGESVDLGPIQAEIAHLQAQVQTLSSTAGASGSGVDASVLDSFKLEVQEQYASLQSALSSLGEQSGAQGQSVLDSGEIASLESSLTQLSHSLQGCDERLSRLEQTPAAAASVDLSALESLQGQVQSLDQKWETAVGKLAGEVQSMPGQVEQIVQKKLEELAGQPAGKASGDMDDLDAMLSGLQ